MRVTDVDRRTLLGAAGGLGALAMTSGALAATGKGSKMPVIDVHTHMFTKGWVDSVRANPTADVKILQGTRHEEIDYRGARIVRLAPEMTDFDMRIKAMDEAGVDVALISLTAPNVYFGDADYSARLARQVNDDFAEAESRYGGRIRWMASLPWQFPEQAVAELKRAQDKGAIGVCTLTNLSGVPLTDPRFRSIWKAIEASGLPVFIHPTTPYVDGMGLTQYGLANTIGFTSETSLCFARMILDGFLDDFPNIKLIACHGGGAFPYLIGRFDQMWAKTTSVRKIQTPPSSYLRRIYFDSIVYDQPTLDFLVKVAGPDRVLYGSDYPFLIADMKGILARVDTLPASQRDAIRGGNAKRLFNI